MTTIYLEIVCRHVFVDELVDFPSLVVFQHPELQEVNVDTIGFAFDRDTTQPDHEVESFDPHEGHLRGWVRIPQLSGTSNTRLSLHVGTLDKKNEPGAVWRTESRLVVHGLHSPSIGDSSGKNTNLTKITDELGNAWVHLPFSAPLELADTLTVEAVIDDPHPQGETLQMAVSQWKSTSDCGPFD